MTQPKEKLLLDEDALLTTLTLSLKEDVVCRLVDRLFCVEDFDKAFSFVPNGSFHPRTIHYRNQ